MGGFCCWLLLWLAVVGCGRCCSEPVVPVTDADVRRLVKKSGKSADEIVRFYDITEIDFESDADAWVRFAYGKRAMGLKKKKNRCQFLDDNKRCTVYEARPATCRTFPLAIETNDAGTKLEDLSLNTIMKRKYPTGPKKTIKQVLEDANREDIEDADYFERIERWNKKGNHGGKMDFLKFLRL